MSHNHAAHRTVRAVILGVLVAVAAIGARAQVVVTQNNNTGWNAWKTGTGAVMSDIQNDQQTGQHTDDFVGDSTYYGMLQNAGTITGKTGSYLAWRFRFDDFAGADKFGGNGGNVGLGLDLYKADGSLGQDGAIDVIMVMSEGSGNVNNRTRTIYFGTPGAGANTGPSTTTWTIDTAQTTAVALQLNVTYDLQQANDTANFGGTADAWLTFAISYQDFQNGINAYRKAGTTALTMTDNTMISFISYTSTQLNALNQDLFGASKAALTNGSAESQMTWADLGAITPAMNAFGRVPEPATYAQLGVLLLAGGAIAYRRRRQTARTP